MHNKVLDVSGSAIMPGAKVIVWPKKTGFFDRVNQMWYLDEHGVIHSALNTFALTAKS